MDSGATSPSSSLRLPCPPNETHAAAWTHVLLNRPTLATISSRMAMKGFAEKRGPSSRNVWNWTRVYLVLQYPFLYYFKSNNPNAKCSGLVYIASPCGVAHLPFYPSRVPHVMQMRPCTRRNLHHRSQLDDEDNFYFSFDSPELLGEWQKAIVDEVRRGEGHSFDDPLDEDELLSAGGDYALDELPRSGVPDDANGGMILDPRTQAVSLLPAKHTESDRNDASPTLDLDAGDDGTSSVASSARPPASNASSSSSALLPRFEEALVRRKSFFASEALLECRNAEDHVHRMHCHRCRISPIIGFAYTCVVCDDDSHSDGTVLCGDCFRTEDHDPRHLFLVSPDVEGETIRLPPPLEGWTCPTTGFRLCELIVFEALFRVMSAELDGVATQSISKRRLLSLWNGIISPPDFSALAHGPPGSTLPDHRSISSASLLFHSYTLPHQLRLTEKEVAQHCKGTEVVSFYEFMVLARTKLATPSAAALLCLHADPKLAAAGFQARRQHLAEGQSMFAVFPFHAESETQASLLSPASLIFAVMKQMVRVHRTRGDTATTPHSPISTEMSIGSGYAIVWSMVDGSVLPRALDEVPPLSSPPGKEDGNISSPMWTDMDLAVLDMLLSACSRSPPPVSSRSTSNSELLQSTSMMPDEDDGEYVPVSVLAQVVQAMQAMHELQEKRHRNPPAPVPDVVEMLFGADGNSFLKAHGIEVAVPYRGVAADGAIEWLVPTRRAKAPLLRMFRALSPAPRFRVSDAVEHVVCYEVGGVFGLFSDQLESMHPHMCDGCGISPIVGCMLEEKHAGVEEGRTHHPSGTPPSCLRFCRQCHYRMEHPSGTVQTLAELLVNLPRHQESWRHQLQVMFGLEPSPNLIEWLSIRGLAYIASNSASQQTVLTHRGGHHPSPFSASFLKLPGGGHVQVHFLPISSVTQRRGGP